MVATGISLITVYTVKNANRSRKSSLSNSFKRKSSSNNNSSSNSNRSNNWHRFKIHLNDVSLSFLQKEEVLSLLCRAQDAHLLQVQDSMTGRGVDRHLFCLYVVSRYLELDSPFLSSALGQPWRLSTSQTAVRGEFVEVAKNPELISVGGGFGPVDDQGYGVSYLFVGEERVFFHVSCKKSNESTDAKEFAMEIKKALADIKALCETGFSEKE